MLGKKVLGGNKVIAQIPAGDTKSAVVPITGFDAPPSTVVVGINTGAPQLYRASLLSKTQNSITLIAHNAHTAPADISISYIIFA